MPGLEKRVTMGCAALINLLLSFLNVKKANSMAGFVVFKETAFHNTRLVKGKQI